MPIRPTHDSDIPPPADHTLDPTGDGDPRFIGPYRVVGELGRGGMGDVLEAWDPRLERVVALKLIRLDRRDAARARARFWREARALAAVSHPNVVAVHDIGETEEGALYLAMARVDGVGLERLVDRPWSPAAAFRLGERLAAALGAAHGAGLVHRDLKPSNVIIDRAGEPRLLDFGLARRGDGEGELTGDGAVIGTPAFMAPEQIDGREVGPPADVWAFGVLLCRVLTGVHPFARESRAAMTAAILAGARAPLATARPDVPPVLFDIVARCLAPDPTARYPDGAAVRAALLKAAGSNDGLAVGPLQPGDLPPSAQAEHELAHVVPSDLSSAGCAGRVRAAAAGAVPAGRRRWRRAVAATVAVAAVAVAVAGLTAGSSTEGPPRGEAPSPRAVVEDGEVAISGPTIDELWLPARPVVDHIALAPATRDAEGYAALVTELLAVALTGAPDRLQLRAAGPDALADGRSHGRLSGRLVAEPAGHLTVILELTSRATPATIRIAATRPVEDAASLAHGLASALAALLGADNELPALPSGHPVAWRAVASARSALARGDTAAASQAIDAALAATPDFAPARLMALELALHDPERASEAAASATALAAEAGLGERDRAYAEVLRAQAARDGDALRVALDAHLARWPWDVDARHAEVSLFLRNIAYGDLREVMRASRELFALAPWHAVNAGRMVRSHAWRGQGAAARALLDETGVTAETPGFAKVFGELALYDGDYAAALALFERGDDAASAHWAIIARTLLGECEDAAAAAAALVLDAERRGGASTDWTYSLWYSASLCAEAPLVAGSALARWVERQPRYEVYRFALLVSNALLAGDVEPLLAFADDVGGDTWARALLWTSQDPDALRAAAARARSQGLTMPSGPSVGRAQLMLARILEAQALLVAGDASAAVAALEALAMRPVDILVEGQLGEKAEIDALLALAYEAAGRPLDAERAWRDVLSAHLGRITRPWLTVLARRGLRSIAHAEAP